eukprot:TRINITY_DN33740_c0_g1_i1.p1 TRINITY_DN33740_c0_g1~~TRINITY_DN33740_c0_g1_i1.p1  ORF type:complete len:443 (-),score=60.38 TRINITY_DN33740_c0_g1_i1:118-1446(-)
MGRLNGISGHHLFPVIALAAQWSLLADPGRLLSTCPTLWSVGLDQPNPAAALSKGKGRRAGKGRDFVEDLEAKLWARVDARRTWKDPVMEVGILFMIWSTFAMWAWMLFKEAIVAAAARALHLLSRVFVCLLCVGAFEGASYAVAVALSVQGCRYPVGQGVSVSLAGGLFFPLCWVYTVVAQVIRRPWKAREIKGKSKEIPDAETPFAFVILFAVGCALWAAFLVPLAVFHDSDLIGVIVVTVAFVGAFSSFARTLTLKAKEFKWSGGGASALHGVGIGDATAAVYESRFWRTVTPLFAASGTVTVVFLVLRCLSFVGLVRKQVLRPFGTVAAALGHIALFALCLAVTSKHRPVNGGRSFWEVQVMFLFLLATACVGGSSLGVPAMNGVSVTFFILWVLQKEVEHERWVWGIKLVATYMALQYLYSNPEHIVSMFDPKGLYL